MCRGLRGCWFELLVCTDGRVSCPTLVCVVYPLAFYAIFDKYSTRCFLGVGLYRRPVSPGLPRVMCFRSPRVAANSAYGLLHAMAACLGRKCLLCSSNQTKAAPVAGCDPLCSLLCGRGGRCVHCDGNSHGGSQVGQQGSAATALLEIALEPFDGKRKATIRVIANLGCRDR